MASLCGLQFLRIHLAIHQYFLECSLFSVIYSKLIILNLNLKFSRVSETKLLLTATEILKRNFGKYIMMTSVRYNSFFGFFFFFFGIHLEAVCMILVPPHRSNPFLLQWKAQSPNHWTPREFLIILKMNKGIDLKH